MVFYLTMKISKAILTIKQHLHQYVPSIIGSEQAYINSSAEVCTASFHKLLMGGDQLTVARARAVQRHRINSASPLACLNGLIPCAQDWHTQAILLQVCSYM